MDEASYWIVESSVLWSTGSPWTYTQWGEGSWDFTSFTATRFFMVLVSWLPLICLLGQPLQTKEVMGSKYKCNTQLETHRRFFSCRDKPKINFFPAEVVYAPNLSVLKEQIIFATSALDEHACGYQHLFATMFSTSSTTYVINTASDNKICMEWHFPQCGKLVLFLHVLPEIKKIWNALPRNYWHRCREDFGEACYRLSVVR